MLEMGQALAQRIQRPPRGRVLGMAAAAVMAVAIALALGLHGPARAKKEVGFVGNRQLRHRAVYFFFDLLVQAGHLQLGLGAQAGAGLGIAGNKPVAEPAKDVIYDGGGVADVGVLGEAGRLEALMGKLFDQRFQRGS